jgi:hypothetical protein
LAMGSIGTPLRNPGQTFLNNSLCVVHRALSCSKDEDLATGSAAANRAAAKEKVPGGRSIQRGP